MTDCLAHVVLVISARSAEDRALQEQLCSAGIAVRAVSDVPSAICALRQDGSEVLVLAPGASDDADVPNALARVRRSGYLGMVLVVGCCDDPSAAVAALDRGADDYVAVACDSSELVARVRALVRRAGGTTTLERDIDGLVVDLRHGVIRGNGVEVALTRREADLLEYLTRNSGHPVTREELARHIWHADPPTNGGTNVVDVYVSYLRRKLGTLGRQSLIRSVRGVGYELRPSSREPEPAGRF
ncbi:MAG: response regulator transcription factor [Gemmatimonadota bacterium]|nr:response regulator transcription factor [Gemmatimonadota bacterium]